MRFKKSFIVSVAFGFLAALSTLAIIGCETQGTSNSNSSNGSLQISSMTVSPSSISVNEQAVVVTTVSDGSNVLANRMVWYAVDPTSAGSFSPIIDTTSSDGTSSTIFTSSNEGSFTIYAYVSETVFETSSITVANEAQFGSGNVDIAINPSMILADGASTTQITVTVKDDNETAAPDSTLLRFSAGEKYLDNDGNGYFTQGVDSIIYDINENGAWDALGYISATAYITGGEGQAVVEYTSGTEAATVYITVRVDPSDTNGISGFAETSIQLTPDVSIASIEMTSDDICLAVKETGGVETSTLRATCYDAYGNNVPEGLQVSFIITDGPDNTDDGEHLGALTGASRRGPYVTMTSNSGIASCPISSGTVSGTIRVRAYTDSVLSNATQIMTHAGPPANIYVGGEDCNVMYWGYINEQVGITALVSDIYHNPCPDLTAVYFTCDEGVIKAHDVCTEGEMGLAFTTWISYGSNSEADGIVYVIAETNGGTLIDSGFFINSWYPATITITSAPTTLNADGLTRGYFSTEVRDLNNNYVTSDILGKIKLEGDHVDFEDRENGDGCFSSGVYAYIKGNVLTQDYSTNGSADDGIGAVVTIVVRYAGMASASYNLQLLTGTTYSKNCLIDMPSTLEPGETTVFNVVIKDRWGNPLGDHALSAGATSGSISPASGKTDQYGEAAGFYYTAPGADATVIIAVSDLDPRGGGVILTYEVSVSSE